MVRITLEFPSAEHAIVALGKLVGAAPAVNKVEGTSVTASPAAAPATASTRKGRADKGKPRGPRTEPTAPVVQKAAEPIASAPAADSAAVDPAPAQAEAPVPSAADAQQGLEKLFEKKGITAAQDLLARYGVKRLRDLLPEQRAEFVAETTKLLEAA